MRKHLIVMIALVLCLTSGLAALPAHAEELWKQVPAPKALPKAVFGGYAQVNGIQLYYAIYGKGEPLVLLHGGLGYSEHWGNQVPVFAKKYKVIVVDSRGHGRSTRDEKPFK